jgi:hypothetical protein
MKSIKTIIMKIILNTSFDSNGLERHRLVINEKEVALIQDLSECPEDAHIGRDLIDGNDIIRFIKAGYECAKAGDNLEIISQKDEEYD